MIANQKIGKSFLGALNYNLKKLYHPNPNKRAELLANNFTSIDSRLIQRELQLVRCLKPNLGKYVYHTSINFPNEDILDNNKMLAIAHEYLELSGYVNNQYLIFRHYDAEHPHLHLLVNRITFDGDVVSDSNNYKKSEAILRSLEVKYGLVRVEPSNSVSHRAVTKDELEMITRTGKASEKMILQELMTKLISQPFLSIQDLIKQGEGLGINFLFNQASTGKVSGITYFKNSFKTKGQSLGNQFKWAEIIKQVNYEQVRDREAVSQANERTARKYGKQTTSTINPTDSQRRSGIGLVSENASDGLLKYRDTQATASGVTTNTENVRYKGRSNTEGTLGANKDADILDNYTANFEHDNFSAFHDIEISDDIDDEAIHGRSRHRQKKPRTNRR